MAVLNLLQKYMPIWAALDLSLALVIGYYFPEVRAARVAMPFLLFVMLYPMMVNLRLEHIGKSLKSPKLLIMAVMINFLITPLFAALWSNLIFRDADPYLTTGFILNMIVPCSGMVAAWTGYAKGKVESALVIVAVSLTLAIFLVPVWMVLLAESYVSIDPLMIFQKMLLIVVLPLIAGMLTRKLLVKNYGIKRFQGLAPLFSPISTCGMLPMIFIIISSQAVLIINNFSWVLLIIPATSTMYSFLFIIAILFSKMLHINYGDSIALGFSVTSRNLAISIGIATTAFAGTLAVLPAAVAPVIQVPVMLLFLNLSGKIKRILRLTANSQL